MTDGLDRIQVSTFTDDNGVPCVQIDTPADSDLHERLRVYVNDALATGWSAPGDEGYADA